MIRTEKGYLRAVLLKKENAVTYPVRLFISIKIILSVLELDWIMIKSIILNLYEFEGFFDSHNTFP